MKAETANRRQVPTALRAAAVLSVSMITILGSTAVSPALSGIKSAFPQMSDAWIQMVLTLPIMCIVPSCLLCRFAVERLGQKRVLLLGILVYLIGGLGAGLMPDFYGLLAMRAVLGVGCGFITPMAQALISSNFEGELRARLTSWSASASYLMGIMAAYLVGRLVGINWRLSFSVYIVALAVLLLNLFFLPDDAAKNSASPRSKARVSAAAGVNWRAVIIMLIMLFISMAFYTFSASISLFMRGEGIGDDGASGSVVAVFMTVGFFVGLVVPELRKILKEYTFVLGFLMMAGGYLGLWHAHSQLVITLSAALIGGSYSVLYGEVFTGIRRVSRTPQENTSLITYTTAGMFFGQAVSQPLLGCVEAACGMAGYRFRFGFLACALFAAAGVYTAVTFFCGRAAAKHK